MVSYLLTLIHHFFENHFCEANCYLKMNNINNYQQTSLSKTDTVVHTRYEKQ